MAVYLLDLGVLLVLQKFGRCFGGNEYRTLMNASGAQYHTNPRCMHHYLWLPTEGFSASENSSLQVSWKFILHATRFSFMWHKHPLAFLVENTRYELTAVPLNREVLTDKVPGFCFRVELVVSL